MSPRAVAPSRASEPPTGLHHYAAAITLDEIFGNGSAATVNASVNRNMVEPTSGISNQSQTSLSNLVLRLRTPWVITNAKVLMKIPPPRLGASTIGPRATFSPAEVRNDPVLVQRGVHSIYHWWYHYGT